MNALCFRPFFSVDSVWMYLSYFREDWKSVWEILVNKLYKSEEENKKMYKKTSITMTQSWKPTGKILVSTTIYYSGSNYGYSESKGFISERFNHHCWQARSLQAATYSSLLMLCSHGHSREQRVDIVCHPLLPSKAICQHFLVHISTQSWEGVTRCPLTNCRHTASSGKWARNVQWCDRPCQYVCMCVCVCVCGGGGGLFIPAVNLKVAFI